MIKIPWANADIGAVTSQGVLIRKVDTPDGYESALAVRVTSGVRTTLVVLCQEDAGMARLRPHDVQAPAEISLLTLSLEEWDRLAASVAQLRAEKGL